MSFDSDKIVGIQHACPKGDYLFFLAVYFPSSNHSMEEFRETPDLLWFICDSYSMQGVITVMGDFNCHLGHLCGGRSTSNPDGRGKLIYDFLNHFNLFLVNLDDRSTGPVETFRTDDGKLSSTVDFIFIPLALSNSVVKACAFDWDAENLSDHIPVEVRISLPDSGPVSERIPETKSYARKSIQWYKLSDVQIDEHYSKPLCDALSSFSDTIWSVSDKNLKAKLSKNRATKKRYFKLPSDVNKLKVELN